MATPPARAGDDERPPTNWFADRRERLIGAVPEDRIHTTEVTPVPEEIVERYLALPDMSCSVADAADALGTGASVSALLPVRPQCRVCGPAVTLRYTAADADAAREGRAVLGDRDLYGLAPAGAVAVIDAGGRCEDAVVGEVSAAWAALAGVAGILADGAVRDLGALSSAIPVWSRGRSPRAARGRLDTAELNGVVQLAGAPVSPGDLVVADDNGAVIVPAARIVEVLEHCERAQAAEAGLLDQLARSRSLPELIRRVGDRQSRPPRT